MKKQVKDRTGMRYGRLVVSAYDHSRKGKAYWECKCDCGKVKVVRIENLVSGVAKSCGCLKTEAVKKWVEEREDSGSPNKGNLKHGFTKNKFYGVWKGIKNRCINENSPSYKDYGGRGIKLSEEWMVFEKFKADMFDSYNSHCDANDGDTSIERVDVDGDYNFQNCVWATNSEQQCNRRGTKYVEYKGEKISVPELSRVCGVPVLTIHNRLNLNWDIERIINTPVKRNKKTLRQ